MSRILTINNLLIRRNRATSTVLIAFHTVLDEFAASVFAIPEWRDLCRWWSSSRRGEELIRLCGDISTSFRALLTVLC